MTQPDAAVALYARLLDAWNARDAQAFAALFAPDGSSIGFDGSEMQGPGEIGRTLAKIFQHHVTAQYVAVVREARVVGAGVTVVRAAAGMVPRGGDGLNAAVNAIQVLVAIDDNGEQRVALFQSTPAAFHGRPEAVDAMTAELTSVLRSGITVRY
ncbi:MAG TPA: SgcJ/EcaC family oxidoreductase [Gemmatimonadaceae bacterium]